MNSTLPRLLQLPLLFTLFPSKGVMATPTKFNCRKHKPLLLYSCEPSIHGRIVRQALSTLQIQYTYISAAKNSSSLYFPDNDNELFLQNKLCEFHFDPKKHFILLDPNITPNDDCASERLDKTSKDEKLVSFYKDDSENAIEYLFETYQNGDTLPMTNTIEQNKGRNGSLIKQIIENVVTVQKD